MQKKELYMSDSPKPVKVTRFDNLTVNAVHFTEEGYLADKPIVTSNIIKIRKGESKSELLIDHETVG